jgi:Alpha-L-arabinofuranosidase
MAYIPRRRFLQDSLNSVAGCSVTLLLRNSLFAPAAPNAATRVYLDTRRSLAPLDRNIFGSFLEHLGRAIYEGVYDPDSKLADTSGFRKDVADDIKQLNVPIVRYPGGNFVSGYHWLDGVGPKKDRPRILEKAWNSTETNQFGTNEFMAWCKLVGAKPLLGLNLGTSTPEMAAALVEYCNVEKGTKWSELRRSHGIAEPHKVEDWCLGNEMDGPWQIGHMTATQYGMLAADAGRQMHYVDQSLRLIACGSSSVFMPTYLEWDREVLEQCYSYVDGISLHRYYGNSDETGGDSTKYMALNLSMDRQIAQIAAVCDYVQGRMRSPKKLWLSFDEWNVWYRERTGSAVNGGGKVAPHLLEETYNLEDSLLVGGLVNSLIRNSDRVRVACLAQLVNVIAPIMTNSAGMYRQTIYYPYAWALQYARGAAMNLAVESPTYDISSSPATHSRSDFANLGIGATVPYVDASATFDKAAGRYSVFLFNRDLSNAREVELLWEDAAPSRVIEAFALTGNDLKAHNGFDAPQNVAPQSFDKPATSNSRTRIQLPARSYTVLHFAV